MIERNFITKQKEVTNLDDIRDGISTVNNMDAISRDSNNIDDCANEASD